MFMEARAAARPQCPTPCDMYRNAADDIEWGFSGRGVVDDAGGMDAGSNSQ